MDYKEIWKSEQENPLTVWVTTHPQWGTKHPQEKLFIGQHEGGYTNVVSMSLEEALVVANAIVDALSKEDSK
jgi:hypothetical protein